MERRLSAVAVVLVAVALALTACSAEDVATGEVLEADAFSVTVPEGYDVIPEEQVKEGIDGWAVHSNLSEITITSGDPTVSVDELIKRSQESIASQGGTDVSEGPSARVDGSESVRVSASYAAGGYTLYIFEHEDRRYLVQFTFRREDADEKLEHSVLATWKWR